MADKKDSPPRRRGRHPLMSPLTRSLSRSTSVGDPSTETSSSTSTPRGAVRRPLSTPRGGSRRPAVSPRVRRMVNGMPDWPFIFPDPGRTDTTQSYPALPHSRWSSPPDVSGCLRRLRYREMSFTPGESSSMGWLCHGESTLASN